MKRILLILLFASLTYGIDTKLTGLTALTAVDNADLLYIIDDVAVTPTSKKITVLDLFDAIDTSAELAAILTNETGSGVVVFGTAPTFTTSITLGSTLITDVNVGNWNTAYTWGDHALAGYLTTYSETDPCHVAWLATNPLAGLLDATVGIEPNDLVVIDSNSIIAEKMKHINITLLSPADILCADMIPVWHNTSGYTFNIVEIQAWSNIDNVSLEVEEIPSETDFSTPTQVQAVEIASNGTSCFYYDDTTPTAPVIETGHLLAIDFDTTDDPNYVKLTITGYYED